MDNINLADSEIISMYFERNEEAIKETDKKYGKLLFRISYNILHDSLDCEECKNDTYLGLWNSIPPERPESLIAYASRIMRNIATNRYKEKSCKKRIPSELTVSLEEMGDILSGGELPDAEYASKELSKLISDFVRTLPERRQYIFMARFYMAENIDTIAKKLGVGLATIHREITKIKQELKLYLERNGVYV